MVSSAPALPQVATAVSGGGGASSSQGWRPRQQHPPGGELFRPASSGDLTLPDKSSETPTGGARVLEKITLLPDEDRTAMVLDQIYPTEKWEMDGSLKKTLMKKRNGIHPNSQTSLLVQAYAAEVNKKSADARREIEHHRFLQFRQKMLEKFYTMQGAFDSFAHHCLQVDGDGEKNSNKQREQETEIPKKDFERFLLKHFGKMQQQEQDRIFKYLDIDKSGGISMREFHTAVEAAAPVRTLEDLRRKWLALGFSSMRNVMNQIDRHHHSRRLTFPEFGTYLAKAGIHDDAEHMCIFNAIRDPHNSSNTVSLDELMSSLAAVSPALLLEDIRDRLMKRYGSLKAAYAALDVDYSLRLSSHEFMRYATHHWRLSTYEARKAFRLIDIDRNHSISRQEFISALALSEPSLFLEEIRRKVRQRFRSIQEMLFKQAAEEVAARGTSIAYTEFSDAELFAAFQLGIRDDAKQRLRTPAEFQAILGKVEMTEMDTQQLFDLMDVDKDGKLTPSEFACGVRVFAPIGILEDLRHRCMQYHARVADSFATVPQEKRDQVMDLDGLTKMLEELGLATAIDVRSLLDLVEPHRDGGVTIGELVAALQSAAPGTWVPLSHEQRQAKARQQVHWQMAPFQRSATELRANLRQMFNPEDGEPMVSVGSTGEQEQGPLNTLGLGTQAEGEWQDAKPRGHHHHHHHRAHHHKVRRRGQWKMDFAPNGDSSTPSSPQSKEKRNKEWEKMHASSSQQHDSMKHPLFKNSYSKVARELDRVMTPTSGGQILDGLHGYYSSAGTRVLSDMELLDQKPQQSLLQQFRGLAHHQALLAKNGL